MRWRCAGLAGLWLVAAGSALAQVGQKSTEHHSGTEVLRPYAAADFALAFDVLLGAGDLQRAFLVAQQAVAAVPSDVAWRRKLAHVSEWTQHPEVAAQQWLALFKQGDRAKDTLAAVLRLAPFSNEPMVAIEAWTERAKHQPLTDVQWRDVLALFEAAAEPEKGSRFFETQFAATRNPALLDFAAQLAENAGEDERALNLYVQRSKLTPFSIDVVLKAVVNLVRRDRMPQALQLMQLHASNVPAEALEYWRLLAQVAWEARDFSAAQAAYARVAQTPQATLADWTRLIFLLRQQHPKQAADLAVQAYRRFGPIDQLLLGLSLYVAQGDLSAQAQVYDSLTPSQTAELLHLPRFLLMRAQFHQRKKNITLAWQDLRDALQLDPQDDDVALATMWFLIDNQRLETLAEFMKSQAQKAQTTAAYWPAFAAANQTLEKHSQAVFWYRKMVEQSSADSLTLLNYADALERTQQMGMADRVRRHAWQQFKVKFPQPPSVQAMGENAELLAFARLSLLNAPGDPGLNLVRDWVSQMRGISEPVQNEQTLALVLGWAIVKEQFENARAWMWRRYAQHSQRAAPLWGLSQTALQLKDTQTMDSLLAKQANAMPIYNRVDTALELGHVQQALDIAFKGMSAQEDAPLYDRYRLHVPGQANYMQLGLVRERLGNFGSDQLRFETRLSIDPRLQLVLVGALQQQHANDTLQASLTPTVDRLTQATLLVRGARGVTSLTVAKQNEQTGWASFSLNQTWQWGGRLNLEAGVDVQVASGLSLPMRVAGRESSLYGNVNYTLGKREYVRISPRFSQYETQWGDALGHGLTLDMELGYRMRTEYPDWRLRGFVNRQLLRRVDSFSARSLARLPTELQTAVTQGGLDPLSYFLPESSSTWGGCVGMGENLAGQSLQTTYSRAWRPFLDVCLNHNTSGGTGLNSTLGWAGSVTGEDHLLMQLQNTDGTQPGSAATQALTLRYRRYF